ncbi:MAG: ACP S-malonyltransferase [Chloroflexi bacterium]|nr:ACP S-malonyltransferase [Chloroflexota bacterium]
MAVPDPSKSAFLFPGQGSQKAGMGKELSAAHPEARAIFEQADELLGIPLSKICWEGPEAELNDTVNTQPALLVHSIAALQVFYKLFGGEFGDLRPPHRPRSAFTPAFVAGHSLGEISAAVAAGALDYPTALKLVRRRGELMKQAGQQHPGGMAAILGLDIVTLDKICFKASVVGKDVVQVANDNCPGQVVISGHSGAVQRAMQLAKEAGARRALPLAVSIAAHSPLMAGAQEQFRLAVEDADPQDPAIPMIGNVGAAEIRLAADLRADLNAQLTARVRWTDSIRAMRKAEVTTFIELGSGNVLTGLLKRIDAEAEGMALGETTDFEKLAR